MFSIIEKPRQKISNGRKEMVYSVNENIKVFALFDERGVTPLRFLWKGITYPIKETRFKWEDREGKARLHHFAVSDGTNAFQLTYNSEHLTWKLLAVDTET